MISIYRIQGYNSIMREYFCIGFIDFMMKSKILLLYTNLSSPYEYKNNDKIVLKYFQQLEYVGVQVQVS